MALTNKTVKLVDIGKQTIELLARAIDSCQQKVEKLLLFYFFISLAEISNAHLHSSKDDKFHICYNLSLNRMVSLFASYVSMSACLPHSINQSNSLGLL